MSTNDIYTLKGRAVRALSYKREPGTQYVDAMYAVESAEWVDSPDEFTDADLAALNEECSDEIYVRAPGAYL